MNMKLESLCLLTIISLFILQTAADVPDIMGVKAIDTTLMYGANDCQYNKHGCSHFCFHKPNIGAVCACPDGYKLDSFNKRKCIGE